MNPGDPKVEQNMRSEDVFAASRKITNRFLLCRVTSVSAHRLQRSPERFTESINKSLTLIAAMPQGAEKDIATGELRLNNIDHLFLSPVARIKPKPSGEGAFEPLLDTATAG
jgi:hypothetical protein